VTVEACAIHSTYGGVTIMEGRDALAITCLQNKIRKLDGQIPYLTSIILLRALQAH
jgi:hypothetical protein